MTKLNRLFTAIAIVMGLILVVYAVSQFDIDLGRKLAKQERRRG